MTTAAAALFGLAFGSFANAAIDRIGTGRPLTGRSACEGCARLLRPWELLPVVSYVALRGRCARCRAPIGARTPLVEAAASATCALAFYTLAAPLAIVLSAAALAAAVAAGTAQRRRVRA